MWKDRNYSNWVEHQSWWVCHRMTEGAGRARSSLMPAHTGLKSEDEFIAQAALMSSFFSYFVSKGCCICAALWVCVSSSVLLHECEVCFLGQEGTLLVRRREGSTLKEPLSKWFQETQHILLLSWVCPTATCSANGSQPQCQWDNFWLGNPFCDFAGHNVC